MFTMSSSQIMAIHRSWARYVRLGDDHEFQLYWSGQRRFVLEFEDDGTPVIERRIGMADLSPRHRTVAMKIAARDRIELIEEVISPVAAPHAEIYVRHGTGLKKIELH